MISSCTRATFAVIPVDPAMTFVVAHRFIEAARIG
jgi:hypothetical protein